MKGYWSLPGGKLRLGETIREGMQREVMEECQVPLDVRQISRPFHCMDAIWKESGGRILFHYVLLQSVTVVDASVRAVPSSDAVEVQWVPVDQVHLVSPLTDEVGEVLARAHARTHTHPHILKHGNIHTHTYMWKFIGRK